MQKSKLLYLSLGFIAGLTYLVACGSSTKVGDAIGDVASDVISAVSVFYDNSVSSLSSTNMQGALDEVVGRVKSIEGSLSAAAASVVNAANVLYDNTTSQLAATNLQAAIDELAARPSGGSSISVAQLIGTWKGTQYYNKAATQNVTVFLGSGGSFSCSGGPSLGYSALGAIGTSSICTGSYTWDLKGHTILLTPTAGGNDYRVILVNSVDSQNIALFFTMETSTQYEFFYGTKQ